MDVVLSAVALAFLAVLFGLATVVFRSKDFDRARQLDINALRQDLNVVSTDVDFLFTRLADIDATLHGHSVLGSDATGLVKDWVSSAHVVLDDVQDRLDSMKSQV